MVILGVCGKNFEEEEAGIKSQRFGAVQTWALDGSQHSCEGTLNSEVP